MNSIARIFYKVGIVTLIFGCISISLSAIGQSDSKKIMVIVNADNAANASGVSLNKIRNMLLLNKKEWPGGQRVVPFLLSEDSNHYRLMLKKVLKMDQRRLQAHWMDIKQRTGTSPPQVYRSNEGIISAVAHDIGAVAVVSADAKLPDTVRVLHNLD